MFTEGLVTPSLFADIWFNSTKATLLGCTVHLWHILMFELRYMDKPCLSTVRNRYLPHIFRNLQTEAIYTDIAFLMENLIPYEWCMVQEAQPTEWDFKIDLRYLLCCVWYVIVRNPTEMILQNQKLKSSRYYVAVVPCIMDQWDINMWH